MTEKWTAGPWSVRAKHRPMTIQGNIHQVTDKDDYPTAFIPAWDEPGSGEIDGTDEAIANAHLIAAAPDLYRALTGMLRHSCVADAGADMKDPEDHEAERVARAALAKARGEA